MNESYDCHTCGACCVFGEGEVPVTAADIGLLPNRIRLAVVDSSLPTKVRRDGEERCSSLVGVVGTRVSCSIYGKRPAVCCEFEPGSTACKRVRVEQYVDAVIT